MNYKDKKFIYRRCPRCKSIIKANLWNCPVCNEGLNPHMYRLRILRVEDPEKYHKIQQSRKQELEKDSGCGKGCISVIIAIIIFIGIAILWTNPMITGAIVVICIIGGIADYIYTDIL